MEVNTIRTQEKYYYQTVYAEYCVYCQHEQSNECKLSLYKRNGKYKCLNYKGGI